MLSSFLSKSLFQNATFSKPAIRFLSLLPQTTSFGLSSKSISSGIILRRADLERAYIPVNQQLNVEDEHVSCPPSFFSPLVSYDFTNRNAREPRRNNQGARPCSSVRRRRKIKRRANDHPFIPLHRSRRPKGYDI
jgi:hypothetical protein